MSFARCAVDPQRLAVGGFSEGASHALSLGLKFDGEHTIPPEIAREAVERLAAGPHAEET